MRDQNRRQSSGHPSPEILFLALEGELPADQARLLSEHLGGCWSCRRQMNTFQEGIFSFVDYHRDVLFNAVPAPPSARSTFQKRLRQRGAETSRPSIFQSVSEHWKRATVRFPRPAAIAAVVALAALVVFVSIPVAHPPALSAAEFLTRASLRENQEHSVFRTALHRRLDFRQGKKRFQRDYYSDPARSSGREMRPSPRWLRIAEPSPLDPDDRFSIRTFARWRADLSRSQDGISEAGERITLLTTALVNGPVRAASITVRKSDWHAVAERIDFEDQPPLEITELIFETTTIPVETPRVERTAKPRMASPDATPQQTPALVFTDEQLEGMEADVRWTLHAMGAGMNGEEGPIRITRRSNGLTTQAVTDTNARRDAIERALENRPGITLSIRSVEDSPDSDRFPADTAVDSALFALTQHQPLLLRQLIAATGNDRLAVERGNAIRSQSDAMAAASGVLMELAERYPDASFERLPHEAHAKILSIIEDLVGVIAAAAKQQHTLFEPVLASSFPDLQADGQKRWPGTQTCVNWQQAAASSRAYVNANAGLSNRLFAVVRSGDREDLSPRDAVHAWMQSQSAMLSLFSHLCE